MSYPENIPIERKHWIGEMANGEWVSALPPGIRSDPAEFRRRAEEIRMRMEKFVTTSCSPEELHYFADRWNWDNGIDALQKVIRNPSCDFSTVQLIFWRASPDAYQECASRDEIESNHALEMWDFIHEILERVEAGSYDEGTIPYNPSKDAYVPEPGRGEWEIPEVLRRPTR